MEKIPNPNTTHVAVGVVFSPENKILVALRPNHKSQGGAWEFPGGKIEPDETAEEALRRELHEEVGIIAESVQPLIVCEYHYPHHRHVTLSVFQVDKFQGNAQGCEGQIINWVTLKELQKLPLLSANHPILTAILELKK